MRSSPFARKIDQTQEAPPTRETVEKLRPDKIRQLFFRGRLEFRHVAAADEIRAIIEALIAAHFPAREMDGNFPHSTNGNRDFTDRLSNEEQAVWLHKYHNWSDQMADSCGCGTRLQLVFDLVVECRGVRVTEARLKIPRNSAIPVLRVALDAW